MILLFESVKSLYLFSLNINNNVKQISILMKASVYSVYYWITPYMIDLPSHMFVEGKIDRKWEGDLNP